MTAGRTPLQSGDAIAAQSDILASDAPLNLSLDLLLTEGKDLSDADLDRLAERSLFFAPKIVRQPNRTVPLPNSRQRRR